MSEMNDHTAYTNDYFEEQVASYDRVVFPLRLFRKKVVRESGAQKGSKVLDVACGTGEQSIPFAKAGCEVIGVDLTEAMLARARRKIRSNMNVDFLHQDATDLPFEDKSFDISAISLGLHDMPREMALQVLKEMRRVTKDDGRLAIVEHHHSPTWFGNFIHSRMLKNDTKYYPAFIEAGLESYLAETRLKMEKHFKVLLGMFQIAICSKETSDH